MNTITSTRGNDPHDAGGRSDGVSARGRVAICCAFGDRCGGGGRFWPRFLRFLAKGDVREGPQPEANGQPLEILTRHQLRSIPRIPHRGREW